MKRLYTTLFATLCPALAAAETSLSYTADFTSVSSYVDRGERYSSGPLGAAMQPSLTLEVEGVGPGVVGAGVWASFFLAEQTEAGEVDPSLTYSFPTGPVELTVGYAPVLTPAAEVLDPTRELLFEARLDVGLHLHPIAGLEVDPFREKHGYAFAGFEHELERGAFGLESRATVGGSASAHEPAGLQDVTAGINARYDLDDGRYVAILGSVAWSAHEHQVYPFGGVAVGLED